MSKAGRKTSNSGDDEVEQMLQAAQDDIILKLKVIGSHKVDASPGIDPDLDRRFQALKNPLKPINSSDNKQPRVKTDVRFDKSDGTTSSDNLFARFGALKKSPLENTSEIMSKESGEEGEDEVEKLIRWAIDAARLDPSPPDEEIESSDDDFEPPALSVEKGKREKIHGNERKNMNP